MARRVSELGSTVTCRCGHGSVAHEHYRRGTDCALCECLRFRTTQASPLARLLERRGIRREPAVQPLVVVEALDEPGTEPVREPVVVKSPLAS